MESARADAGPGLPAVAGYRGGLRGGLAAMATLAGPELAHLSIAIKLKSRGGRKIENKTRTD